VVTVRGPKLNEKGKERVMLRRMKGLSFFISSYSFCFLLPLSMLVANY
jgi:hypothetical protein